jgi:hypothetical protein
MKILGRKYEKDVFLQNWNIRIGYSNDNKGCVPMCYLDFLGYFKIFLQVV